MLDHCSISHKGGLVLWSRSFTPEAAHLASSSASPVNSLIREALIEGRTTEEQYERDGYAVKWTFVNDLELIFVVAYQRILQLTYVNDLLSALKSLFVKSFEPFLTSFVASLHTSNSAKSAIGNLTSWNFAQAFEGWDAIFDQLLKNLENKAAQDRKSRLRTAARSAVDDSTPPSDDQSTVPSLSSATPHDEQQIARNVQALKNRLRGRGGRRGGGGGRVPSRNGLESVPSSDTESPAKRKSKTKAGRKWGDEPVTESDMASLDYSLDKDGTKKESQASHDLQALVDQESLGTRTSEGLYEVKDWEFSKKKETDKFIAMALKSEADKQASSSSLGAFGSLIARLTGSKTLSEQDLKPVLEGMMQHLMKKNVAKEIAEKVCEGVGESLVGKKVGSFESISGAVEQLRVHVRNLSMLGVNGAADSKGRVELFERGYGKDAAAIAKEAIAYGMRDSSYFLFCAPDPAAV
ncbi:hypothetical protein C0992_000881 [Termitomyces sp. T32_za158]|nr:hypothetical protein C0992_000881 [Termitomyces sp. T32_za158]